MHRADKNPVTGYYYDYMSDGYNITQWMQDGNPGGIEGLKEKYKNYWRKHG
jgi:hypothetical protein